MMQSTWRITYSPHRWATTLTMNLGTVAWCYHVTWAGYLVAYTVWQTG